LTGIALSSNSLACSYPFFFWEIFRMLKLFIGANNLQAGGRGNLAIWPRQYIHYSKYRVTKKQENEWGYYLPDTPVLISGHHVWWINISTFPIYGYAWYGIW
jgi:hypothetical protein